MSDRIYDDSTQYASENFVTIAQACHGVLTKRNFTDGTQKSYDHVKFFNFTEILVSCLEDIYHLSIGMIDRPNCCFIRARIKDEDKCSGVVRKCNGDEATLVLEKMNWFALDIDWNQESSGNLAMDSQTVLLALPAFFNRVEYFAVASASYLFKPGIRMRLFFWAKHPVSGIDLKNALKGYKHISDEAMFNPIQPIYTAAPLGVNPVTERIFWKKYILPAKELIIRVTDYEHYHGAPEIWYTKKRAILNAKRHYERITLLAQGERHQGLRTECLALGKLVGQNHFDRDEVISLAFDACSTWYGKHDTDKDMKLIIWSVDKGIEAMDRGN